MRNLTRTQIILSITVGCIIEGMLVAIIFIAPPDPPMSLYNSFILLSQIPGLLIGRFLLSATGIPATNQAIGQILFLAQAPFYVAMLLLYFKWNNRRGSCGDSVSAD